MTQKLLDHRLGAKIFLCFLAFLVFLSLISFCFLLIGMSKVQANYQKQKVQEFCQSLATKIPEVYLEGKVSFDGLRENWESFVKTYFGEEFGIDLLLADDKNWKSSGGWGNLSITNFPSDVLTPLQHDKVWEITVEKKSLLITTVTIKEAKAMMVIALPKNYLSVTSLLPYAIMLLFCFFVFGVVLCLLFSSVIFQNVWPHSSKLNKNIQEMTNVSSTLIVSQQDIANELKQEIGKRNFSLKNSVEKTSRLNQLFFYNLSEMLAQLHMISGALNTQNIKVEKMTISLMEISAAIKSVASNADKAVKTSQKSEADAKQGGEVVQQLIRHMNKITKTVSNSAEVMKELARRSHEIGDIVNVIDDIADQTELLALNAAIQAARAGEQGRGFGVVADQIRSLAEKTTQATKEIAETLSSIQEESTFAVKAMDNSKREIDHGTAFAVKAGVNLQKIVAGAKRVTNMISVIATSAETQSGATTATSELVDEISNQSQKTYKELKQALSHSEQLVTGIHELGALIEQFLALCSDNKIETEVVSFSDIVIKQLQDINKNLLRIT